VIGNDTVVPVILAVPTRPGVSFNDVSADRNPESRATEVVLPVRVPIVATGLWDELHEVNVTAVAAAIASPTTTLLDLRMMPPSIRA
jgi:hypothetical protein